ncbi:pyridoxamine 5'-phosphate oxidase [Altibacter sp. HG106]|uniref:pyridoxamine 5'-phosphate oxidase n=1 Tax=Altibacter sp. HG106 TaxID=3023937 RepID=UPI0023504548|nr:pyridoxamine 5'-phosphate oxidase [Altibacter sp. HG106]MDC7996213.1 pyridoxamine 5'-phosphate oxidase [Altibacter sp. HG106]
MAKKLHSYRASYEKGALTKSVVAENPFQQFKQWFEAAEASETIHEINAMTLSTVDATGAPRGRVVLLKEYSQAGFVFYTNYSSEKGTAIAVNPAVSLSFFWPALEQQIIIKGTAQKVPTAQSEAYFKERPRKSQLGALVSNQSTVIESRQALEDAMEALEKKYEGKEVPKPEQWGGYLVTPSEFEFWQGRRSRLHDRIVYRMQEDHWVLQRLQP